MCNEGRNNNNGPNRAVKTSIHAHLREEIPGRHVHSKSYSRQSNIPPPKDYTPRHHQPGRGALSGRHKPYIRKNDDDDKGSSRIRDTSLSCDQTKYERIENMLEQNYTEQSKRTKIIVKNRLEEDDYFSQIKDEESINPPGKTSTGDSKDTGPQEDDEDDPLDAYMKSLEGGEVENQDDLEIKPTEAASVVEGNDISVVYSSRKIRESRSTTKNISQDRGVRLDIDEAEDNIEVYINHYKQRTVSEDDPSSQDEYQDQQQDVNYDDEDNIISVRKVKKDIEPLAAIDHSTIQYESIVKNFYNEHPEIAKLTLEQSEDLRSKLEIKVSGKQTPKPVCSFAHFNFDEQLMKVIRRSDYVQPTPIQAQAIPVALSGRDLIGIAQTGSGKTAAYLWPMINHIMGQPDLKKGDGPIGLVLVPTRELALQVYGQAKKFSNSYNIAVVCAYGGGSKYEQSQDLEAGAEIVVATPGRLMDLIRLKATNLRRVTYFVLDEADRFFDMGFEEQVTSICQQVRPDRQTLFFSATFKHKTEQLASRFLHDPIKIVQRTLGEVNEDVTQHVITFKEGPGKWNWLLESLVRFTSSGSVVIFVTRISNSEELHKNLEELGKETLLLHGDMEQSERNRVISSFKKRERDILIATDVAARGLDISHIRTVINYDVARDIDTHIHRIGRTGRAGSKGDAYTLITDKDRDFAGYLVKNLETSNQVVGDDLIGIAMRSHAFRKLHQQQKQKQQSAPRSHTKQQHRFHDSSSTSHHQSYNDCKSIDFSNNGNSGNTHNYNKNKHHNIHDYQNEAGPSSSQHHQNPNRGFEDDRKRARWN